MVKYFSKLFKDLEPEELIQVKGKYFICLHSHDYRSDLTGFRPYFEYLVIYDKEFICRFKNFEKAEDYVKWKNSKI
ncbi:MAG: hypothetical protein HC831_01705 [Chloroflexia bacterium]|nr:hypothetical protein [Chloroflexia bacterium]